LQGFIVSEKDAQLDGAENHALRANHENMCRFDDPDDPNCKKVLASVRNISEAIENLPAPVRPSTPSTGPSLPTDLRILSLGKWPLPGNRVLVLKNNQTAVESEASSALSYLSISWKKSAKSTIQLAKIH
jgi:hypothetical protein